MSSIRNLLFFAFSLASIVLAQAAPQESQSVSSKASDKENFRELLNALPEESIHAALDSHARPKYKEGVFEFHKDALDKVHDDDPLLASKVVQWAAILELRKRQAPSNTSSTTTTSSDSSSSTPPSTSVTTTTVTSDSTTTETITSTTPSPSSSPTVTTSSTPSCTPTDSSSPPPSSTLETSRTRSLVVITTTLTDGHVKTITEYTYVAPTPAETDNAGPSATHNSPSLQSGAANVLSRRWGVEAAALVGGAVGVAWML